MLLEILIGCLNMLPIQIQEYIEKIAKTNPPNLLPVASSPNDYFLSKVCFLSLTASTLPPGLDAI